MIAAKRLECAVKDRLRAMGQSRDSLLNEYLVQPLLRAAEAAEAACAAAVGGGGGGAFEDANRDADNHSGAGSSSRGGASSSGRSGVGDVGVPGFISAAASLTMGGSVGSGGSGSGSGNNSTSSNSSSGSGGGGGPVRRTVSHMRVLHRAFDDLNARCAHKSEVLIGRLGITATTPFPPSGTTTTDGAEL